MYTNYLNSNYYRVPICKCQHVFIDFDFRARLRFSQAGAEPPRRIQSYEVSPAPLFPARVFALPSNQLLERPTHMKPTFTTKKQTMNQTL